MSKSEVYCSKMGCLFFITRVQSIQDIESHLIEEKLQHQEVTDFVLNTLMHEGISFEVHHWYFCTREESVLLFDMRL